MLTLLDVSIFSFHWNSTSSFQYFLYVSSLNEVNDGRALVVPLDREKPTCEAAIGALSVDCCIPFFQIIFYFGLKV